MAKVKFPILGTSVAPMLGRRSIMQRLWNDLTKPTPSHLSIVGPRYSGKTVLLHALASRMNAPDSPYHCVVLWDLGHLTPASDADFLKGFCRELSGELQEANAACAAHLASPELGDEYGALRDVVEMLEDEGQRVLILCDGFDKPLSSGLLTRNLWDQLRELASSPSLRLVTATRRPLPDLIRSSEEAGSDFWNIFDQNDVRVGAFDDDDRAEILSSVPELTLGAGASTEIENWSGGYPPLYLAIINELLGASPGAPVGNAHVNDAALRALGTAAIGAVVAQIWDDCPTRAKELYRHLIEHGGLPSSECGVQERAHLAERSLIRGAGNKVVKGCRLLERHVSDLEADSGSLIRHFAAPEDYERNFRAVLELRLSHVKALDATLRRFIGRSIEDIPEHPEVCVANVRGIVDRALDLICAAELGEKKEIPQGWLDEWKYHKEGGVQDWTTELPSQRGDQIRLIQLMLGTRKSTRKAKHVSKNVYALVNAAHGFGNFGQHLDGADVPVGVAVSAVMTCLELAACLERELP